MSETFSKKTIGFLLQNIVCIASTSIKFMSAVTKAVQDLVAPFFPSDHLKFLQKKVTSSLDCGEKIFSVTVTFAQKNFFPETM